MSTWTKLAATALVLGMTPLLLAERPSLPEIRDAEASHILVGQVKNVYERKIGTGRHGPGTIEGHYIVEIEVDEVERGKGLAPSDLAYVRCWRVMRSGPTVMAGASGQPIDFPFRLPYGR